MSAEPAGDDEIGIAAAIDAAGKEIRRVDLDLVAARNGGSLQTGLRKPLRCGECTAGVDAVSRHIRLEKEYPPKFRLSQHQLHEPGCIFDLNKRIDDIIEGEPKLVTRHPGGIIRLNLQRVPELLADVEKARLEARRPASAKKTARRATTAEVERVVAPVISAARQLIRLMHDFDEDPRLAARFQVQAGDTRLSWPEFCWPADPAADLIADIEQHPKRIRAVFGLVEEIETKKNSTTGQVTYSIKIETKRKVFIRTPDPLLAATVRPGMYVVGVGAWSMFRSESGYQETRLWPEIAAQVATWKPRFTPRRK